MNIKIIEPIGESENAIRSRLKGRLEKSGDQLTFCDSRGWSDAELIPKVNDADVLLLSNRPVSRAVIEACPKLKLICVAFTGSTTSIKTRVTPVALFFIMRRVTPSMR